MKAPVPHSLLKLIVPSTVNSILKISFILLAAVALSACLGGGGGGGSDGINTGHFTDSAVAGLTYTTATQFGTTDATGKFTYKNGETITFSLGGIVIGETVAAKSDMSPFDLVPGATLYTNYT